MPGFIAENLGVIVTVGLVLIAAIAGYATLKVKVKQNCKAVVKLDEKVDHINEHKVPFLMSYDHHTEMCGKVNSSILSRLDRMDSQRESTRKSRDEQISKMVETLGYIKGKVDSLQPAG